MIRHASNAMYGLLDYVAYPVLMLAASPVLLRHLGVAAFGLWIIANSAVSAGSIVSSGFGDAVIQRVAVLRSGGRHHAVEKVIANMLAINLSLSGLLCLLIFVVSAYCTARITHNDATLEASCLWSLRTGAVLIVLKSIESVFISTEKAFECYAAAIRVSLLARMSAVALSIVLTLCRFGLPAIMAATAVVTCAGVVLQGLALRRHGIRRPVPGFDRTVLGDLMSFGLFSWIQAISGMLFSQADKLILAMALGASAVSYYAVAIQVTQPVHGLTAAGLHFIFPYLSGRYAAGDAASLRAPILRIFGCNLACSALFTLAAIFFGATVLERWMGTVFAAEASRWLPLLALGFGLLSLNVTAHYAMLAMGRASLVTAVNVLGGLAMLCLLIVLIPNRGVGGAALARLAYGPLSCLLYVPLFRLTAFHAPQPLEHSNGLTEGA